MRRKLIAGNWKMHGITQTLGELDALIAPAAATPDADVLVCPPATLIAAAVARLAASGASKTIRIGAQDCHMQDSGAHTGDIAASMLADAGADFVIVGHSERRADHHETDAIVHAKAQAAWRAGLGTVICIGETGEERDSGAAQSVVASQIAGSVPRDARPEQLVIAYEPVWAIGTGRTPSVADIAQMHAFIRETLAQHLGDAMAGTTRLLYGGSVKPDNAQAINAIPDVDGVLVGGASLKASDFAPIIQSASASRPGG